MTKFHTSLNQLDLNIFASSTKPLTFPQILTTWSKFRYLFPDICSLQIVQVLAQIKDNFLEIWEYEFN